MRRLVAVLASSIIAVLGMVIAPATASAHATGYDYIVTPRWAGHCPGSGNAVKAVFFHVYPRNGHPMSGGDYGNDIVYVPVHLGVGNLIQLNVQCTKSQPYAVEFNLWPNRSNVTYFVSSAGRIVATKG